MLDKGAAAGQSEAMQCGTEHQPKGSPRSEGLTALPTALSLPSTLPSMPHYPVCREAPCPGSEPWLSHFLPNPDLLAWSVSWKPRQKMAEPEAGGKRGFLELWSQTYVLIEKPAVVSNCVTACCRTAQVHTPCKPGLARPCLPRLQNRQGTEPSKFPGAILGTPDATAEARSQGSREGTPQRGHAGHPSSSEACAHGPQKRVGLCSLGNQEK